ncbi:MAG: DUF402 domain-containing protein [Dehalococcoidales bacterium]|nr:DUF402 domain-containing protein [Dehalococcoidales bacterium]
MSTDSYFQPGQTVVSRQLWQGKIWQARPEIVVQDTPELITLFLPGTGPVLKRAVSSDGSPASVDDKLSLNWDLADDTWVGLHKLRLSIPGEPYSVIMFREMQSSVLSAWYINLEEPLYRTTTGFDYTDMILDIVAFPDLSHWRWKDEHELRTAVERGHISIEKAELLYEQGLEVIAWLQSGESPFTEWTDWQPDPAWPVPVLPENWDSIQ